MQAAIRNSHQFNGQYGCPKCYHEGSRIEKGDGFKRVYCTQHNEVLLRNASLHLIDCHTAVEQDRTVHGVKGPPMLMKVPKFDIVKSFVTEYMLCLQGIMKGMLSFWFDSGHHEESYYLRRIVACIDRELNEIKPPNEISRLPSAVSCRQQWKASEYRSFLLCYGPVVLKCKLPSAYYTHFMMLSRSIYLLLQETIQEIQLESIHHELQMFVQAYERLYGKESVTYNVHQLSHFVANVRCWGPLWAYSAFPFESMNHTMLKMKHGTQHTAMQIANAWICQKHVERQAVGCFSQASNSIKHLHKQLQHRGSYQPKTNNKFGPVSVYGKTQKQKINESEASALCLLFGANIACGVEVEVYFRFSSSSMICHGDKCRQDAVLKRCNSIIQASDLKYYIVKKLIVLPRSIICDCVEGLCICEISPVMILQKCKIVSSKLPKHSQHIVKLLLLTV